VVRLEGTNSEEAHIHVNKSGLGERLQMADGIREAAKKQLLQSANQGDDFLKQNTNA
jgi:hypothetical protein